MNDETAPVSEETKLKEEIIKAAKDKQQKDKRDKKKTNVYTTEELELLQKRRLAEYRKAQEQRADDANSAIETGSVLTEHSTQDQVEDYELQQDIFLKKLKEEKINEQKMLEEAIKGKVRGNIKMFQRAASATNPPMPFGGRQDNNASVRTPDQVRKFQPVSSPGEKEMEEKSVRKRAGGHCS